MRFLPVLLAGVMLVGAGCTASPRTLATPPVLPTNEQNSPETPMSYHGNIIKDANENENFRRVVFTGPKSQLVVMRIPPGGEVGEETHQYTEQTLFFLSGTGEGTLDDKAFPIGPGDA